MIDDDLQEYELPAAILLHSSRATFCASCRPLPVLSRIRSNLTNALLSTLTIFDALKSISRLGSSQTSERDACLDIKQDPSCLYRVT